MLFRNALALGSVLLGMAFAVASSTAALGQEKQLPTDSIEITQFAFQRPVPKDFPEHIVAFKNNSKITKKPAFHWTFLVKTPCLTRIEPKWTGQWLEIAQQTDETVTLKPQPEAGLLSGIVGGQQPENFALSSKVYQGQYGVVELEAAAEELSKIAGKELSATISLTVAESVEVETSEVIQLDKAGQTLQLAGYEIRLIGEVKDRGIFFDPVPVKKTAKPSDDEPKTLSPVKPNSGSSPKQIAIPQQGSGSSSKPIASPKQGSGSTMMPVPVPFGRSSESQNCFSFEIKGDLNQLANFSVLVDDKPLSWRSKSASGNLASWQFLKAADMKGVIKLKVYKNLRTIKKTLSVTVPEN